jgi:WD40 repeat protein
MHRFIRSYIATGFLLVSLVGGMMVEANGQTSPQQFDYPRSGLDWYTIETEHFEIHFHGPTEQSSTSRTAQVVARVAEDIYGPITRLYGHEPDSRVSIVLMDYTDYSNGAAYFFDNMIRIWVPYLDSSLRGDHHWLRNVITHEFTHIVQLQTAMKAGRQWPYSYLQYFSYEDVRRPDVLYGYPDGVISYPVPTLNNPAWFAEGTAQYQRADITYDTWDSHRDMLLRTQVLDDRTFDLTEMGGFYSYNSLERESVYNHGYAFTRYLADSYGERILRTISEELSAWDNWNLSQALSEATDRPADSVFAGWKTALNEGYRRETRTVRKHGTSGEIIESQGFSNLHPAYAPEGDRLAYLSNQGEDYSVLTLYVRNLTTGHTASVPIDHFQQSGARYTCSLGHPLVRGVNGSFDWHPDGDRMLYARMKETGEGYRYSDIFEIDLDTEEKRRLTHQQRASAPAYAPDASAFAFVGQNDGTSNLYLRRFEAETTIPLTDLPGGGQVTDPVWHPSGNWIYFARTSGTSRDIYRLRPDGSDLEAVVQTSADERTPAFDPEGEYLYFSSDRTGIFNIYRRPVEGDGARAVTNVIGGAFMPTVNAAGELVFAQFEASGYSIARLAPGNRAAVPDSSMSYRAPAVVREKGVRAEDSSRSVAVSPFDDTDVESLGREFLAAVGDGETLEVPSDTVGHEIRPYEESFTSFSVFPVLRIDQYNKKQSGLGNRLVRNTKGGVYFISREIIDRMRLTGGLVLGWGSEEVRSIPHFFAPSRLLGLERDGFLQFDYLAGLPFIPKRWSPQFSVELYNTRRNVSGGLSVEEYPCTACYPDTTRADVAYALWEADFLVRSKLSEGALLELGYRYSPYRVRTEPFFSREHQETIAATSDRYFIGRAFTATGYLEQFRPYSHADVLREGLRLVAGYEYQSSRLLRSFDIDEGALVPEYERYRNHRLWMESYGGFRLPGQVLGGPHGVSARVQGSTILGGPVDDFFNSYVGGLTGARGYPFYGLGGNETLWFQAAYHFPIVPSIGRQFLFLYADKLFGKLYADAAMAWEGAWPGGEGVRKDIGGELRLGLGSFYLLPTSVFVSATYSLDSFDAALSEGFVTPEGARSVTYGREWLWHFGVLFDFDLDL